MLYFSTRYDCDSVDVRAIRTHPSASLFHAARNGRQGECWNNCSDRGSSATLALWQARRILLAPANLSALTHWLEQETTTNLIRSFQPARPSQTTCVASYSAPYLTLHTRADRAPKPALHLISCPRQSHEVFSQRPHMITPAAVAM